MGIQGFYADRGRRAALSRSRSWRPRRLLASRVRDTQGRRRDVPADPGTIVINAGDMPEMATDGLYRSTPHRVLNPPPAGNARARLSMPLFLHPWPEVWVSPRHAAGGHLDEHLRVIGLKS